MNKPFSLPTRRLLLATAMIAMAPAAFAAAFTAGNVVVIRVGDGSAALTANVAAPVFLDEFTPSGGFVQTFTIPTTGSGANRALTLGGANTAEGALTRSVDTRFLTLGGYDAAVGATGIVAATAAAENRVIGRVDASGAIDTSTIIPDGFSAGRIAGVVSDDGTHFWSAGSSTAGGGGGSRYSASLGALTSSQVSDTPNNIRWPQIFNGQLYTSVSFNTGGFLGISTIGTGIPTTSGQTLTVLPGLPVAPTHSHFGHFFADANTLYIADDGTAVNGGGLQKWTLSAGTWTQAGAPFPYISPTTNPSFRGLTGTVSGANVTLYLTTTEASANSLVKWTSTDSGASGTFTTLATAPTTTNATAFRGVAMAPDASATAVEGWELWR